MVKARPAGHTPSVVAMPVHSPERRDRLLTNALHGGHDPPSRTDPETASICNRLFPGYDRTGLFSTAWQSMWPILLFISLSGLSDGIGGLIVGAKAGDLFPATDLGLVMGLV